MCPLLSARRSKVRRKRSAGALRCFVRNFTLKMAGRRLGSLQSKHCATAAAACTSRSATDAAPPRMTAQLVSEGSVMASSAELQSQSAPGDNHLVTVVGEGVAHARDRVEPDKREQRVRKLQTLVAVPDCGWYVSRYFQSVKAIDSLCRLR